jgi:hypothetical protein
MCEALTDYLRDWAPSCRVIVPSQGCTFVEKSVPKVIREDDMKRPLITVGVYRLGKYYRECTTENSGSGRKPIGGGGSIKAWSCLLIAIASLALSTVANGFVILTDHGHGRISSDAATTVGERSASSNFRGGIVSLVAKVTEAVDVQEHQFSCGPGCIQYRINEVNDTYRDFKHFDNNSFAKSLEYIGGVSADFSSGTGLWGKVQNALHVYTAAKGKAGLEHLVEKSSIQFWGNLGGILHADQDFYAHSNYVELMLNFGARVSSGSGLRFIPPNIPTWDGSNTIRITLPSGTTFTDTIRKIEGKDGRALIPFSALPSVKLLLVSGGFPTVLPQPPIAPAPIHSLCPNVWGGASYDPTTGLCGAFFAFPPFFPELTDIYWASWHDKGLAKDCAGTGCPHGLFNHPSALSVYTLYDFARDLAIRKTIEDLEIVEKLHGSVSGKEFLGDLLGDPERLAWLNNLFDPENPNFADNYASAMGLSLTAADIPVASVSVPATAILFGIGLIGLIGCRLRHAS